VAVLRINLSAASFLYELKVYDCIEMVSLVGLSLAP
jgi:hypothetical protein